MYRRHVGLMLRYAGISVPGTAMGNRFTAPFLGSTGSRVSRVVRKRNASTHGGPMRKDDDNGPVTIHGMRESAGGGIPHILGKVPPPGGVVCWWVIQG